MSEKTEKITENKIMPRWLPVLAGVFIQLCLGIAYVWGVFQIRLESEFSWKPSDGTLAFALLLAMLTFGSMFGGVIAQKFSVRAAIIAGGIVMGGGFILASFAGETPWILWLGYGVIGGFGSGMAYTNVIAVCQRWFPDKRGLITGIIVAALGMSSVVFTPLTDLVIIPALGVMQTFALLGVIFIIICFLGSFFVKNPPEGYQPEGWTPPEAAAAKTNFTPGGVLKTPQFYMLVVAFMFANSAGFMVIPYAKTLAKSLVGAESTSLVPMIAVMIIGAFNSLGRIFWGFVSDKMGRKPVLIALMLLAAGSILLVPLSVHVGSLIFLIVAMALTGIMYGGFMGVFPALTADYYGPKNNGINYGMVMFGFSAGAVIFSYVASYFKHGLSIDLAAFIIGAVVSVIGAIIIMLLSSPKVKD